MVENILIIFVVLDNVASYGYLQYYGRNPAVQEYYQDEYKPIMRRVQTDSEEYEPVVRSRRRNNNCVCSCNQCKKRKKTCCKSFCNKCPEPPEPQPQLIHLPAPMMPMMPMMQMMMPMPPPIAIEKPEPEPQCVSATTCCSQPRPSCQPCIPICDSTTATTAAATTTNTTAATIAARAGRRRTTMRSFVNSDEIPESLIIPIPNDLLEDVLKS